VALYGPFWLRGSQADFTGLRAMAREWEFNSTVYAILRHASSPALAQMVCAIAFGILWIAILRRWARSPEAGRELPPGEWIFGGWLLLSATANPWYALWLWPFAARRISATLLCALAAVSLAYLTGANLGDSQLGSFDHPAWLRPIEFGLVALGLIRDWWRGGDRRSADPRTSTSCR
jgi:hypothetical protein